MVSYRYRWIALLLVVLALTACSGNKDKTPTATPPQVALASATSEFPPTWTPVPTRTPPPRVTIDYTYEAPYEENTTPGAFPTRAPVTIAAAAASEQQPVAASPQPAPQASAPLSTESQLVVSRESLNNVIGEQFSRIAGGYFQAAPQIQLDSELIRASLTVYTTASQPETARPVVIEMSAAVEANRVALAVDNVYFTDDETAYQSDLTGYIRGAIETAVNDLLNEQYIILRPTGGRYTITRLVITEAAITADITAR